MSSSTELLFQQSGLDANTSSNLILDDFLINYTHVSVVFAAVPKTYYMVNSSSNDLTINGTLYNLPIGNYTAVSFATQINVLVPNSCTFSQNTAKYTFNYVFVTGSKNIAKLLGIDQDTPTTGFSLRCAQFQTISYLKFLSNNVANNKRLLLSFDVQSTLPFSVIIYEPKADINLDSVELLQRNTNIFSIYIYDDDDQPVDFNGNPYSITLKFTNHKKDTTRYITLNGGK